MNNLNKIYHLYINDSIEANKLTKYFTHEQLAESIMCRYINFNSFKNGNAYISDFRIIFELTNPILEFPSDFEYNINFDIKKFFKEQFNSNIVLGIMTTTTFEYTFGRKNNFGGTADTPFNIGICLTNGQSLTFSRIEDNVPIDNNSTYPKPFSLTLHALLIHN